MAKLKSISHSLVKSGVLFYLFSSLSVKAQVVPDGTLPINSKVQIQDNSTIITGGTESSGNLFHSFDQFSVPTGSEAYFNNVLDVKNIFSRVTGSSISNIDGLIRANGTTDLFLLNSNGIIFGPNARLNIGGSFLGTTASSLNFADGTQFSTTSPQAAPLLVVNVPVGLGFGSNSGQILVQGPGAVRDSNPNSGVLLNREAGLFVQPSETLALIGNGVVLEGGILTTDGGRIELGSVAGSSFVNLTPTDKGWAFDYTGVQNFENIQLLQQAAIDASSTGGGDIQVQGRQLTLSDGSQIENSILGVRAGGTLRVTTSDFVELIGTSANGFPSGFAATVAPGATGNAGDLSIETGRLSVRDGAQIQAFTLGAGAAGTLTVRAKESVELVGTTADGQFSSRLSTTVGQGTTGNGGNLIIETGRLSVRDGARIQASTFGSGAAGTLTVRAKESVEVVGTTADGRFPTYLVTSAQPGATGNAGDLIIETGRLSVRDGAQIQASTFGSGAAGTLTVRAKESVELVGNTANARFPTILATTVGRGATGNGGNLTIETGRLSVRDGAQTGTATAGTGSAGTLTVKAKDLVELIRTTADGQRPSALSTRTTGVGNAGNLTVETRQLTVQHGARVTVSSEGSGRAGQLEVQADSINLENQAKIIAETFSGEGGNIALQVQDSLQLRGSSQISAEASGTANGGNIGIETGTLGALENSDITANAVQGQGGNIQIRTQGLFFSTDSNITASSQLGINGLVEINTLDFDARNALIPLTSNFVSTEQVVAGSCLARRNAQQGSFIITGSGGLPTTPYSGIAEWNSLTEVKPDTRNNLSEARSQPTSSQLSSQGAEENYTTNWKPGDPIIEAQGIVKTVDGRTLLGMKPQQVAIANTENAVCSAASPKS